MHVPIVTVPATMHVPIVRVPATMHVPIILLTVRNYSSSHFVKMRHIAILIARTASLKKELYIFYIPLSKR
jgi:hypothetical protein